MASTNGLYTKKIVNWIWIWGFNTRPIKKWTGTIWGNINLCCLKAGHLAKWIKMVSQKNSRTGMATKWSVMDVEKIRGSWNLFRIKTDVVYPRAFRPKNARNKSFSDSWKERSKPSPTEKKMRMLWVFPSSLPPSNLIEFSEWICMAFIGID